MKNKTSKGIISKIDKKSQNNKPKQSANNLKSKISEQNKLSNINQKPIQNSLMIKPLKNINPMKPNNFYETEYKNLQAENTKLKNELVEERKKVILYIQKMKNLSSQIELIKSKIEKAKNVKKSIKKKFINNNNFEDELDFGLYYEDFERNEAINEIEQQIIDELCPNPDKMTYEQLLELEEKVGNVNKGLNEEKIKKIPFITFKKGIYQDCDKCIICQEEFIYGEKVKLLNCGHVFHEECIGPWLLKEKKCPFCKEEIKI